MSRLACPFCGARELREFQFRKTQPTPRTDATPYERVYERMGSLDESTEHWQHVAGCRAWLLVRRNPSTGEVHAVTLLGTGAP